MLPEASRAARCPGRTTTSRSPNWPNAGAPVLSISFKATDARLATREFVVGERYTIADISAMVLTDMATGMVKLAIPDDCLHMRRWYAAVSARPSAKA